MIRVFQIAVIGWLSFCIAGCTVPEKKEPIREKIKVGDIAPSDGGKQPGPQPLKTINFDVYIYEIPAENVGKLTTVWQMLYSKPLRFNNYNAFKANFFSVRFGQYELLSKTIDLLRAAGGQSALRISLLLSDGQPSDIAVTGLNRKQNIRYVSADGLRDDATIGPGVLALQIKAEKTPAVRGVCDVMAHPVFLPPMSRWIPQMAARAKLREFHFNSAGFGLKMGPGDFILLGPERYISDQTLLGGLFFSKPEGSIFLSETDRKLPQPKVAVRILLLVCTGINY
jgi:hypothetical protein